MSSFGTGKALVRVLVQSPDVLLTGDWKTMASIVEVLKRFQLHETKIREILVKQPQLLSLTLPQLRRNTEVLADLIIMEEDLLLFMIDRPDVLSKPQQLFQVSFRYFNAADCIGCSSFKTVLLVVQSDLCELLVILCVFQNVERVFLEIGLGSSDARACIQKVPKLLIHTPNKMGKTINALGRGGLSRQKVAELIKLYPRVLLRR